MQTKKRALSDLLNRKLQVVQSDGRKRVLYKSSLILAVGALELYDQRTRAVPGCETALLYESGNRVKDVSALREALDKAQEAQRLEQSNNNSKRAQSDVDLDERYRQRHVVAAYYLKSYGKQNPWPVFVMSPPDFQTELGILYTTQHRHLNESAYYGLPAGIDFEVDEDEQDDAQTLRALREARGDLDAFAVTAQRKLYPLVYEESGDRPRMILPLARHDLWSALRDSRFRRSPALHIERWVDFTARELTFLRGLTTSKLEIAEDGNQTVIEDLTREEVLTTTRGRLRLTEKGKLLFEEADRRRG